MKAARPRPKKALSQCFLTDKNYVRKIVAAARIRPDEHVLEIGPGQGALTRALAERAARLTAIELDRDLLALLKNELSDLQNIELIRADALRFDYGGLKGPMKVVANLPYAVATPLILRLVGLRPRFPEMIVMVQKEVAQRIVARPGEKSYGMLSVSLQLDAQAQILMTVPRTCFYPSPKVDSAVLRLAVSERPRWPVADRQGLSEVLRAAFGHRRKFLRNALTDNGFSPDRVEEALHRMGLDVGVRAERLSPREFCLLADRLFEIRPGLC